MKMMGIGICFLSLCSEHLYAGHSLLMHYHNIVQQALAFAKILNFTLYSFEHDVKQLNLDSLEVPLKTVAASKCRFKKDSRAIVKFTNPRNTPGLSELEA